MHGVTTGDPAWTRRYSGQCLILSGVIYVSVEAQNVELEGEVLLEMYSATVD